MAKQVWILKGLPASGKSTWAKQKVKEGQCGVKRVNKDSLRAMLDGGKYSKGNERFVKNMRDSIIAQALLDGKHVIVDDTNLNPADEEEIRGIVTAHNHVCNSNVRVIVKDSFLEVSPEECIARDAKRSVGHVGADVILKMARRWLPAYKQKVPEIDMEDALKSGLPWCIIYDLDGTAAIMGDRSPYDASKCDELDRPNWALYYILCAQNDTGDIKMIAMSGRDGAYYEPSKRFLDKHKFPYDEFYIRPEGDTRKDCLVKEEMYRKHIEGKYNVLVVFDDRDQVVDLWRNKLDLPCFQVNYGDF